MLMTEICLKSCKYEMNKIELLCQMTRDGYGFDVMKKKLTGHKNILLLIITEEGKVYGGYTKRR